VEFSNDRWAQYSQALEFLTPVALGERKWPYPEIGGAKPEGVVSIDAARGAAYRDKEYQALMSRLPDWIWQIGAGCFVATSRS